MRIGSFDLAERVLIVAEVGNNHEGDLDLAKDLVRHAAQAGADAVKFQTFVPERLVAAGQADRLAQLRRFQLTQDEFRELAVVADFEGITFLSTPFDVESVRFLDELVPAFKIASSDNDFLGLIEAVAKTGKPIILSTGLADLAKVARSCDFIRDIWGRQGSDLDALAVLHCSVCYPTPAEEANLAAIRSLATLEVTVGYSDHTLGVDAAVLSVAVGAHIVEKHFTIAHDHSDYRDHALSADPGEFSEMVQRIRQAEKLLGSGEKVVQPGEQANEPAVRRSIVAARPLGAGAVLGIDDLDWVRQGGGLPVGWEEELLGRALVRDVEAGEGLTAEHVGSAGGKSGPSGAGEAGPEARPADDEQES